MMDPDLIWAHDPTTSLCESQDINESTINDIWSKFEMILTPPRTPPRDSDFDFPLLPEEMRLDDFPLLEGDDLQVNLDTFKLDEQLPSDLSGVLPVDFTSSVGGMIACQHGQLNNCSSCEMIALAGTELRHDCMWTGTCSADAHVGQKNKNLHDSTCTHISDYLDANGSSSLSAIAGFTHLEDLCHRVGDSDDDFVFRPETPESCENDDDDDFICISPPGQVAHSDHTYHMPSAMSKKEHVVQKIVPSTSTKQASAATASSASMSPNVASPLDEMSVLYTPESDDEEVDVEGFDFEANDGSNYFTTTLASNVTVATTSSGKSPNKRSATTTSTIPNKKIKQEFDFMPTEPTRKIIRLQSTQHVQQTAAESVKLKPRRASAPVKSNLPAGKGRKQAMTKLAANKLAASKLAAAAAAANASSTTGKKKGNNSRPELDDPDRREMHNNMERMRRVDLKNSFEELRLLVPDLIEKEKAPKVEILRKASYYCINLRKQEQRLIEQTEREKKQNALLVKRLKELSRLSR